MTQKLLLLALALYCGSFVLPAATIDSPLSSDPETTLEGWLVFLNIPMWFINPFFLMAWLANVLLWRGWYNLYMGQCRKSAAKGLLGLLLGVVGMVGFARTAQQNFLHYDYGAYVWLSSFAVFAASSLSWLRERKRMLAGAPGYEKRQAA